MTVSAVPRTIGASEVVGEIRKLVLDFGEDHIADSVYRKDGQPECIVGHVVSRLTPGLELPEFSGVLSLAPTLTDAGYAPKAIAVLHAAQNAQDDPKPWRDALTAALAAYYAIAAYDSLTGVE